MPSSSYVYSKQQFILIITYIRGRRRKVGEKHLVRMHKDMRIFSFTYYPTEMPIKMQRIKNEAPLLPPENQTQHGSTREKRDTFDRGGEAEHE